jgi:hypothetical protein
MHRRIRALSAALVVLLPWLARGQTECICPQPAPPVAYVPATSLQPPPLLPAVEQNRPDPARDGPMLVGGPLAIGGPFFGGFDPRLLAYYRAHYAAMWFPTEPVANQPSHLGFLRQDVGISVPVYSDCTDTWAVSFSGRNETFSTEAILPKSDRRFPEDLWAINFGTTYAHRFDEGWYAGGTVTFGSASDEPFHSIREMTVGLGAFAYIPVGARDAWLLSLFYSPTAEINFPIPMAAYIYNPSDYLRINIGLPFQVMYRPTEDIRIDFAYMLLRTVHAQVSYRVLPSVSLHVGFDWENESYFLAGRQDVNDRLFYYDKRLSAGVLFQVCSNFTIDLSGGYTFDRFYFEGAQYSDKSTNIVNVGDGPYLSLVGRLRW